jgi:hypothetical protein
LPGRSQDGIRGFWKRFHKSEREEFVVRSRFPAHFSENSVRIAGANLQPFSC